MEGSEEEDVWEYEGEDKREVCESIVVTRD